MVDKAWMGYVCVNGSAGIHNKTLVICTVKCPVFVTRETAELVDDSEMEVVNSSGCTDDECVVRLLTSLIRHPNIGGVPAVGLGYECAQPQWPANIAAKEEKEAAWMFIQDQDGTKNSIDQGLTLAKHMKKAMEDIPRKPMRFDDLIIGAEYGGSDFTSGLTGDIMVGRLFDQLVDTGGMVVFEEIVEAMGLKHILVGQAAEREATRDLAATYDKVLRYCRSVR